MINQDLFRLVPQVFRARGWRLYTEKAKERSFRLIDLWQYGGRAILGHNPPGLLRAFKNSGERGLLAPFPHFAEERFFKALAVLLPNRTFRVYENEDYLNKTVSQAQLEPLQWRPFLDKETQLTLQSAPVLVPVLPCSFPGAPAVLALDPAGRLPGLPSSQVLSPAALAAAARCIYDLIAGPDRGNPHFLKIDRAVKKSPVWKRQGIYLYYAGTAENYNELFQHFLEGGFFLPPSTAEPAILPGELSPGEEAKLAALIEK